MTAPTQAPPVHDWRLVAPWWHWPKREDPDGPGLPEDRRAVRSLSPVLQKYDGPDLVNRFLTDPQRRLKFVPATDEVHTVGGGGFGEIPTRETTGRRKLFLPAHHRHYLVVCSLHCDVAGFPNARRDDVCEAGFVVRRRTGEQPARPDPEVRRALRRHSVSRRRREAVERQIAALRAGRRPAGLRAAALEARLRAADRAETDARTVVQAWARSAATDSHLEGWISGEQAGAGAWAVVEEAPEKLTEASYSLLPLIADPTRADHDATGETVYFGVIPTVSSDVDGAGTARYDEESAYEIRCFVRRHRPHCPRDGSHCRCPITWSEPTESYQLAPHADLEGTANRPVTVQMPDLRQLHADAIRLGPGAGGLRFRSPVGSELNFTADGMDATERPANTDVQTCSFAIPLLTIVAMFVFRLFMPIVVLVFQLWFLLMLKFCFPPRIDIGATLRGQLDDLGDGLEIDATVAQKIFDNGAVRPKLAELLGPTTYRGRSLAAGVANLPDKRMFAALTRNVLARGPADPPSGSIFEERRTRAQVVEP